MGKCCPVRCRQDEVVNRTASRARRDQQPWYDNRMSYNPAVHRIKQAMFHSAVITDLAKNPLPTPHPELIKYMRPPSKIVKRAAEAVNNCKSVMGVQKGMDPSFQFTTHASC
jgi:hypothetical protein